jgi:predicted amidohydrolase
MPAANEITKYTAAAVQYEATIGDKKKNVSDLLDLTSEAARRGAKLIVLPEMAVSSYCYYSREEIQPYVETIPGPTTNRFAQLAKSEGCHVVVGLPEVEPRTGAFYNALALIGPSGLVGKYRKTHAFVSEPKWAKEGDLGFQVWETELGRLTGVICFDSCLFETNRVVSLRQADVFCYPTAWLLEKGPPPVWITRAFENGVYYVAANRWSVERTIQFIGNSCIINPDGTIQAHADSGNQVVYGQIDLGKAREKKFLKESNDKLSDRRPSLYHEILQNTYFWNPLMFWGLYGHDPLPPGRRSRVAVAQFEPSHMERSKNLKKISKFIEQAGKLRNHLLVLPELATTGIPKSDREAADAAEDLSSSETIPTIVSLAKKYRLYVVIGLAEKEGSHFFNAALLIGPKGIVSKYRKTHLNVEDRAWATAGDRFETFDIPLGRVGLLIGYDLVFPETARTLAIRGADLICAPSAMSGPKPIGMGATQIPTPNPNEDPHHWFLWRVRAGENNTYLAFSNYVGSEYVGMSGVFGPFLWQFPRNEVMADATSEGIYSWTVDTRNARGSEYPTNVVRAKDLVRMRHPYWYDALVEESVERAEHPRSGTTAVA